MGTMTSVIKSTPKIAWDATITFFLPHKTLQTAVKEIARHQHQAEVLSNSYKTIKVLNNAVCFNQGAFIQYSFLAAERHKEIKDEFRKKNPDREKINLLVKSLLDFLNDKFHEASLHNFEHLRAFYSGRHEVAPRICIKGNFRTHNKDTVISVFRDRKVKYISDCDIEQNTGFYRIFKTGKYYLNNNIPKSVLGNEYKNPRLDRDLVLEYISNKKGILPFRKKTKTNIWDACWKDYNVKGIDKSSFYKSTLIIPMTLRGANLSHEFKQSIKIENVERVIFGFLCFDHVSTDYFIEEVDVPLGYIFADILSLYLITRLVYTEISETFHKVDEFISRQDYFVKIEEIEDLWKHYDKLICEKDINVDIQETTNNQLYKIDNILVKYIKQSYR